MHTEHTEHTPINDVVCASTSDRHLKSLEYIVDTVVSVVAQAGCDHRDCVL